MTDDMHGELVSSSSQITALENQDHCNVPWENDINDEVGVALNGKLLNFMYLNRQRYDYVLKNVLYKAQVFSRMSPDDKAKLVELL
jgi:magnesium-transporting ATPase (P-type)